MKKVIFSLLSVLLVAFAAITIFKSGSSPVDPENGDREEQRIAERENIQRFWKIYRQATEHRIAGRIAEAAEAYRRALALNDRHEDALYYLGNASMQLGRFEAAENAWQRLIHINPASARAHLQLGNLYMCVAQEKFFDLEAAEAEFRRAFELNKEETGPLLRLGQIALLRGDLAGARKDFEAVIRSNFRSVEAYFLSGYIAWREGNARRAREMLARAVQYARPVTPAAVPGEGDTKTGAAHGLSQLLPCRAFHAHIEDLSELDESDLSGQMEMRYRELDAYLARINKVLEK